MDNREFVKVLLCEATELLTEAGARQKYLKILANKQDKVKAEHDQNDKRLEVEPIKRDLFNKNKAKSAVDTAKMKLKDMKLTKEEEKIEKAAEKYSKRVTPDEITAALEDKRVMNAVWVNMIKDKRAKEAFMKDFGGKKPNNVKLHERINKRGAKFKSVHESVAVLLTEAALLLNESVGVKDKSTDKVVKVFNSNKEAAEWIANNGGNDVYQLTNRLK